MLTNVFCQHMLTSGPSDHKANRHVPGDGKKSLKRRLLRVIQNDK